MTTDRELLELAAKAVKLYSYGYDTGDHGPDDTVLPAVIFGGLIVGASRRWNPLANDAQAFRLAVELGMYTAHDRMNRVTVANEQENHYDESKFGGDCDPFASARRTIVEAAAEIGKGME